MRNWRWFILSLIIILLDQASKQWALMALATEGPVAVLPYFNLYLAFNTGAAFSFLQNTGAWHLWFFVIFSSALSIWLIFWIQSSEPEKRVPLFALSLILGGALGNLIDRLHYGHVIDFIDLHYQHWHWPIFNLADSAICIAAILLLLDFGAAEKKTRH